MLKDVNRLAQEFLEYSKNKPIRIISHYDTDGITAAAILIKTFKRLDKKFTLRIIKGLEKSIIDEELKRQPREVLVFSDLASGNLKYLQNMQEPVFILDHHEIEKSELNKNIKIVNPHLTESIKNNQTTGAGICYLFSRAISQKNKDLSYLAMIGIIGDRHESNKSKINQKIINDVDGLIIQKGLIIYPATRPLRRTLEWSTSPYIPGVTGNGTGAIEILQEAGIKNNKSLIELNQDEMSKLIAAIAIRRGKYNNIENILGNLYLLKFYDAQEDVREISVLINACSRLGHSDVAISYCLENKKAKARALDIYTEYKHELVSGIKIMQGLDKINGKGFVIMNAKNKIEDVIIGTICSMLSSSSNYEEGTILIGMAYREDKIKISARTVGQKGRNLKRVLEKTISSFKNENPNSIAEVGGHHFAAGCLIEKEKESSFIETLKKELEIEIVKV